jgi:hypothetical protein
MSGYWNSIDPKETKQIIQNERDCFRTRAEADAALEASGRFKRQNETRVVGSGGPTYPAIPSGPYATNPIPSGGELDRFGVADPSGAVSAAGSVPSSPMLPATSHSRKRFKRRF